MHLIRGTFHLASKRDWDALRRVTGIGHRT
jgi:hypothetical protein